MEKNDWVEVIKDFLHNGKYVGAVGKVVYPYYYKHGGGFVYVELFMNITKNEYWCDSPANRPKKRFDVNEVVPCKSKNIEELCRL